MKEKICCFCGHREILAEDCRRKTANIITYLIEHEGVTTFYSGHMDEHDRLCEDCVVSAKNKYENIRLCWVAPYLTAKNYGYRSGIFDEIIIPDLGGVHYKRAITMRNRYMADKADIMLCYIERDYGGAYEMMKYANKTGIRIIMYDEEL